MPPKRKEADKRDGSPKKKTKSNEDRQDEQSVVNVDWVIPKEKRKPIFEEIYAKRYAQTLYQRAREEININPQQAPLPNAQLRTPIYRSQTAKDLQATNPYLPSASLRNLFNHIKRRSTQQEDSQYKPAHLSQRFNNEDRNVAVVLSRAEDNEILTLTGDQRLEVIANGAQAHIDIIRRASSESGSALGYFVEVPRRTSVTVNGITYTNSNDSRSTPFYIGPLEGYAIIELLSQPVFFYRTVDSLSHTASPRAVTEEELRRRDQNGDVAIENTTVRWTPVVAPPPDKGSKNEADAGDAAESNSTENLEEQFSDAFTDEGEPIKDPCHFLRAQLIFHQRHRYHELIPRILASTNSRQPVGTGFSFQYQDRNFRPGRTLLVPLNIDENHILLAAQVKPDKQIDLRVLDPMTWRTTLAIRTSIFKRARDLLSNSGWWQHVFDTSDQMANSFPDDAEWVPAAQVTTADASFTYTILNAWALAMGLAPDPSFMPSLRAHESFFVQAQQMFDLALQDRLTWKLLLAFFRCTKFVKAVEDSKEDGEAKLPDKSRRFDLRKRSFQDLMARQTAADTKTKGKKIDLKLMTLGLEDGKRHRQTFTSDSQRKLDMYDVATMVREGEWDFEDTAEDLRRRLKERAASAASLPLPPNPYVDTDPVPKEFDPCLHLRTELNTLVDEVNIAKSVERGLEEVVVPTLTPQTVDECIKAVGRAIDAMLPSSQGFTLLDLDGITKYSNGQSSGSLDNVVLVLHQTGEHFILVVFQHENDADYPRAVARVLDSAPWTLTGNERVQFHDRLRSSGRLEVNTSATTPSTILGPVLTWMHGPQQTQVEESGYFAIMSAWAVLLGLPINNDFHPKGDFFQKAILIFQASKRGYADWKLIWAFLRCVGYTRSEQPPPLERRFRSTTEPTHEERRRIDKERALRVTEAKHNINYPHFPVDTGLAHTKAFPWDDIDEADRRTRIPKMIKSGQYSRFLSPDIERAIQGSPCTQFHKRLNEILQNKEMKTKLKDFRDTKKPTLDFGGWLQDYELSLAIASVTLAITEIQDRSLGFGVLAPTQVEIMKTYGSKGIRTPRSGRPLIVPLFIESHFVLLVIQLNDENEPTFSVLDSKAYHLSLKDRRTVHTWARRFASRSQWLRKLFPEDEWNDHLPKQTTWVPVSQQPSDSECGYYTILNGWSLALGLTPNPSANIEWTDQFYSELQDVIHLARIGQADWSLIYNFLRCYNFILDGEVPNDRHFSHTTALLNETDIQDQQATMNAMEDFDIKEGTESLDVSQLKYANRIPLYPGGRQHDGVRAFPSDKWSSQARSKYANDLARNGRLNLDFTGKQLREAHETLRNLRGSFLKSQFEKKDVNYKNKPREQLLKACQDYFGTWHTGRNLLFHYQLGTMLQETLDFYRYIFQKDFLGDILRSEESGTGDWDTPREASDISLAIAAVVAAIDDLQQRKHTEINENVPFAGGFTLSTSNDIALAAVNAGSPVSRPRRCWLMPLSLLEGGHLEKITKNKQPIPRSNGIARGHHILVVLQETKEEDDLSTETVFEMNIYDSAPAIPDDAKYSSLTPIVTDIASRLKWSEQRLGNQKKWACFEISAPEQQSGGWQCGPHVVINAWILALGLRPNPDRTYDDRIYQEFDILARAAVVGLLDWQTLVAWILYRRLAFKGSIDDITPDRQFHMTDFWLDENALTEKIQGTYGNDELLKAMTETEMPYDRGNNPVRLGDDELDEARAETNAADKEEENRRELSRSHDDPDLVLIDQHRYTIQRLDERSGEYYEIGRNGDTDRVHTTKRKLREEVGYSVDFLRGSHANSVIEVSGLEPPKKRQRLGDGLSFLDRY